ncbi:MAG: tetratricopeptide repeat protein [Deltaproteobacteria bacterium]|nr:tetratricopeptide repeat protein [Deltaproteobacteria bacterium]
MEGERELSLLPLATPPGPEPPEQLVHYPSVRLFVDRAQAVRPDFQVTEANAPEVAALCIRLEGLPLALELAAGRAQVLTPAQLLERLAQRFDLLERPRQRAVPRHATLRAAVEWSYQLLSPELRRFFAQLAVFRGSFALEAAERVCSEPLAVDRLAELVECSLLLADTDGRDMRFRMLETLRECAGEHLSPEMLVVIRRQHAEVHLELAERALQSLKGPDQREWLDRLAREHDNFRAVLEWSVSPEGVSAIGLRLAMGLWEFWNLRGHIPEGRRWFSELLDRTPEPTLERGGALWVAGVLAFNDGDLASGRALHEEGLGIRRDLGDRRNVAASLNSLGVIAWTEGDYPGARTLLEESLTIEREFGDRRRISSATNNLGLIANEQGDFPTARRFLEESLALERDLGEGRGLAYTLSNLALVAVRQGDYSNGRRRYEEALALSGRLGDKRGIAYALANLGNLAREEGDTSSARERCAEALALFRELDDKRGIAHALGDLGSIAGERGDAVEARSLLEESLDLFLAIGEQVGVAWSHRCLGDVALRCGDLTQARALYAQSLSAAQELGSKLNLVECLEGLAAVATARGRASRATRLFAVATAARESLGAPLPPRSRTRHAEDLAALREALGEGGFVEEWSAGGGMSLDEAIDFAPQEDDL